MSYCHCSFHFGKDFFVENFIYKSHVFILRYFAIVIYRNSAAFLTSVLQCVQCVIGCSCHITVGVIDGKNAAFFSKLIGITHNATPSFEYTSPCPTIILYISFKIFSSLAQKISCIYKFFAELFCNIVYYDYRKKNPSIYLIPDFTMHGLLKSEKTDER